MKALIIEDEPRAQKNMENLLLTLFPDVQVIGITGSVRESLDFLDSHDPDVIFMDVELSDGNCFDIFAKREIRSQVVMTTAYDNYAVKAFEVNSVDYLLKPIETEDLRRAVSRVRERLAQQREGGIDFRKVLEAFQSAQGEEPQSWSNSEPGAAREKFLIRLNDRIVPVHIHDIAYFYSEAKNSYIVTKGNVTYVHDDSLDTIEGGVPRKEFFRISRGVIVSESVIDSVSKLLGGRLRITLKPGIEAFADMTVSRSRADAFLQWLEG